MLLVISVGGDILNDFFFYSNKMLCCIPTRQTVSGTSVSVGDILNDFFFFFFFYSNRKLCCIPTRQTVSETYWRRPRNMYSSQKTAPANLGWYSIFSARPMQSFYDTHRHMRRGGGGGGSSVIILARFG